MAELEKRAHQADPSNRARLRWRARRGLLENDIILTRFLDAHETELTDEEVSVLCDIERDGSTHPHKQAVLQHLREQGFVVFSEEPLSDVACS